MRRSYAKGDGSGGRIRIRVDWVKEGKRRMRSVRSRSAADDGIVMRKGG